MVRTSRNPAPGPAEEHRFELQPNCSLSALGAKVFVGGLAAVTFAVAAFFALQGFWPVLPFAGAEITLLAWAVHASRRQGSVSEVIVVSEDRVVVERRDPRGRQRTVFPRHWARVTLRGPQTAWHPSRLTIESHGRVQEVGRFLTESERLGIAERLRRLVGNTSESPALGS